MAWQSSSPDIPTMHYDDTDFPFSFYDFVAEHHAQVESDSEEDPSTRLPPPQDIPQILSGNSLLETPPTSSYISTYESTDDSDVSSSPEVAIGNALRFKSPLLTSRHSSPSPVASPSPRSSRSPSPLIVWKPRRRRQQRTTYVESDDGDFSDLSESDDYVPSPPSSPTQRQPRLLKHILDKKQRSPPPSPISPSRKQKSAPPSRNKQSATPEKVRKLAAIKRSKHDDFVCPECGWRQDNKRGPDFARHLKSHARPADAEGWVCKGVLASEADLWDAPGGEYTFRNQVRVGGCMKSFSRRDAFKRHLDNPNKVCVGRACLATEEPVLN